jgi:hypothetical protein
MIRVVYPGSGSGFFTHPGSRIQGSKRHRIPDPDLQLCGSYIHYVEYFVDPCKAVIANSIRLNKLILTLAYRVLI